MIGIGPSPEDAGNITDAGTMTVTGDGSEVTSNAEVNVGENEEGSLSVLDGATLLITLPDSATADAAVFGVDQGVAGYLDVSGTDSIFEAGGNVDVGYEGSGFVTIENDGEADVMSLDIGRLFGSDGTVTVTGVGSLTIAESLQVGDAGTGALTVDAASTVSVGGDAIVGDNGGTGQVTVTGDDSTLTTDGYLDVGDEGSGTLMVEAGGVVTVGTSLNLGDGVDGNGTVTVTGTDSDEDSSKITVGTFLVVGDDGKGTLAVTDNADRPSTPGNPAEHDAVCPRNGIHVRDRSAIHAGRYGARP
jgi:T5SS/PEP-CTERM-associated repeat protein